ncbi:radical SAM protein [Geomonas nitrogeniifigens]|uniref:4Fe-4S single cluster domain-containing protein n=1 Tax=Geomonas diazotrophica TaxID=2843197 RepID=UPI001C2BA468|nr:4Fe-4S single cluster domain-containing protein [Geomonas nitrogeniifigens]QXE85525.1 radical SAM protein [Geomonas nitrogeniifigens]
MDHYNLSIRLGHPLSSLAPSLTNGPGWRINLWTQGCSLRCTENCLNPDFLSPTGGYAYPASQVMEALLDTVKRSYREVDGITILGGEPTDQLPAVIEILKGARYSGLSTMVYSGRSYEWLAKRTDSSTKRFLELTDILVDGPFDSKQYHDRLMWRGSANQRILCLSTRYTMEDLERTYEKQGKGFSLLINPEGLISISGLQSPR